MHRVIGAQSVLRRLVAAVMASTGFEAGTSGPGHTGVGLGAASSQNLGTTPVQASHRPEPASPLHMLAQSAALEFAEPELPAGSQNLGTMPAQELHRPEPASPAHMPPQSVALELAEPGLHVYKPEPGCLARKREPVSPAQLAGRSLAGRSLVGRSLVGRSLAPPMRMHWPPTY